MNDNPEKKKGFPKEGCLRKWEREDFWLKEEEGFIARDMKGRAMIMEQEMERRNWGRNLRWLKFNFNVCPFNFKKFPIVAIDRTVGGMRGKSKGGYDSEGWFDYNGH
ncbi:hypothetical protein M5689_015784 [Euphorbia peplus]|nr:hypothetical protein M5689_015784 [Euphorbia peplus]